MKKFFGRTVALALTCNAAMPVSSTEPDRGSWFFVAGTKKLSAFIDVNSVKRVDDYAVVHKLFNYKIVQFSEEGVPYLSTRSLTFFDCDTRQSSMFKLTLYPELWAGGEVVKEMDLKIPWLDVPSGSVVEGIMESACDGVEVKTV